MRKLALLTATAIAALAMTTATASAAIEVRDPSTAELCPDVEPAINKSNPAYPLFLPGTYESGGCTVSVTPSEATWVAPTGGGGQYCYINYDLHIDAEGWGYADNFVYDGCPWETNGSRPVFPGDVNPFGFFPATDQDTDLNVYMQAERPSMSWQTTVGVSLDATASDPLALVNQTLSNGNSFSGGIWEGNAGLDITHN